MGYVGNTWKLGWSSWSKRSARAHVDTHGGTEYIEKMKLLCNTTNTIGEEKSIALVPGDFLRRIFEACTWACHPLTECANEQQEFRLEKQNR